jgi:enolase
MGERMGSKIKAVVARELLANAGSEQPGVEATVITEDGSYGSAFVVAGLSFGKYEAKFVYDGGGRYAGRGVLKAVNNVNKIIAPRLKGMEVTEQRKIDNAMIELDGTEDKSRLGGNAIACVSAAALKAAANSLRIPLYKYIGEMNARILPVPSVHAMGGSKRYCGGERAGHKPSYEFGCYGFKSFSEAVHAGWMVKRAWRKIIMKKYDIEAYQAIIFPKKVKHDRELWEDMTEAIIEAGYEGRIGLHIDVAAGCYYNREKDKFIGLFSKKDKTKEDLMELYKDMVKSYPVLILEDPLDENDYEGHAILTRSLGIEIVGDDLFTTNPKRLQQGIDVGACNAMLLKVNQIGTISEAFDTVQFAYRNGYSVMPCESRGEGEAIADYAVGLGTGHISGSGGNIVVNRLLKIENELGSNAKFPGRRI